MVAIQINKKKNTKHTHAFLQCSPTSMGHAQACPKKSIEHACYRTLNFIALKFMDYALYEGEREHAWDQNGTE